MRSFSPFCSFSPHTTARVSSIYRCFLQIAIAFGTTVFFLFLINFTSILYGVVKFDPLAQLPGLRTSGFIGLNSRSNSSTVLYIHDFGAIGNEISDDTEISGTIVAPRDPDVWQGLSPKEWLYFRGVEYLTVEGGGTIDGSGQEWWARSCKTNRTNPCRRVPKAVTFKDCQHLTVRNIMSINSQQFHMSFIRSKHIMVSKLRVFAPAHSPNTDGIHFSGCKDVEVKDCTISTGDDCISIVGHSSEIRIKGITCGPGHGISIGSLGKANRTQQVHDIEVNGAKLTNTKNGVRIKTWQGGKGFAKDITFQNLLMENVSNPIIIYQYYCDSFMPCANQTSALRIHNVSFVGIKGTSTKEAAMSFACSDTSPCTNLYLEDILLTSYTTGRRTKSFCWQAYGSSSGPVYPPPCFSSSSNNRISQHQAGSSTIQSI